jgi:hypothetical protein
VAGLEAVSRRESHEVATNFFPKEPGTRQASRKIIRRMLFSRKKDI